MRRTACVLGTLLASFGIMNTKASFPQDNPGTKEAKMTAEDVAKKNPIPSTPEGLAEVRKNFGYNCAMCHGKTGDGKGDLVEAMKLEMRDWRDASSLEKSTDGELFWIITNGKGKMPGEGDRSSEKVRWNYVNLVRSLAKKGAAATPKPETPPS
jgi:mono/diheme cytochrome c family protein